MRAHKPNGPGLPHNATDVSGAAAKSPASVAHRVITVWLVEDNETFRNTVRRILNQSSIVECPHCFSNAEETLEALQEGAVADVILMDVELPGVNGIEAARRIKSMSPATLIIMLTVFDSHDKIFKAICAGASGYLLKTSSSERIIESIQEVFAGGAPMTPQVARSVLDMFARSAGTPHQDYGLTAREQKILELMIQGLIKKEIADQLSLSYHTVDTHLRNIYTKLHVHTRTGAVAKALKERLF
jgi:DNA-binding NarL/FixJ family response regulator